MNGEAEDSEAITMELYAAMNRMRAYVLRYPGSAQKELPILKEVLKQLTDSVEELS